MEKSLQLPSGYHELLQELKGRIRTAQVRAGLAVSRELVLLYWSIGRYLSQRFATEGWASKINERLASDLQAEFPGVEGFSPRNCFCPQCCPDAMRAKAKAKAPKE